MNCLKPMIFFSFTCQVKEKKSFVVNKCAIFSDTGERKGCMHYLKNVKYPNYVYQVCIKTPTYFGLTFSVTRLKDE